MDEAERIAKGLNEAQREAVLLWSDYKDEARLSLMLAMLKPDDLPEIRRLGLATKPSLHKRQLSVLTPLGLAVRDYLIRQRIIGTSSEH